MGHRRERQRWLPDGDRRSGDGRRRRSPAAHAHRALSAAGARGGVRDRRGHRPVRSAARNGHGDAVDRREADAAVARLVRRAGRRRSEPADGGAGRPSRLGRLRGAAVADRGSEAGDHGQDRRADAPRRRRVPPRGAVGTCGDERLVRARRRGARRRDRAAARRRCVPAAGVQHRASCGLGADGRVDRPRPRHSGAGSAAVFVPVAVHPRRVCSTRRARSGTRPARSSANPASSR